MKPAQPAHATLAAHRFGLGEARAEATVGADPRAWLLSQIGPADAQRATFGDTLLNAEDSLRLHADLARVRRQLRNATQRPTSADAVALQPGAPASSTAASMADSAMQSSATPSSATPMASEQPLADQLRAAVQADVRSRFVTAAHTARPFAERLALFWANHFAVSVDKASVRALAGPFEREAIRPHIAGRFEDMLRAAVLHPAMLRYLDNDVSAGPHSRAVQQRARRAREQDADQVPRLTGLNENLAREILELHTLGAPAARAGVYTQADVTAFAAVLTGWRLRAFTTVDATPVRSRNTAADVGVTSITASSAVEPGAGLLAGNTTTRFDPSWHEPGDKTVLGQRVPEGPDGLALVLTHLANHPATASFVATKLVRHFVADDPPAALVAALAKAFTRSGGDLSVVYRALIDAPEAWLPAPAKFKSPEEMVISAARLLGMAPGAFERIADGGTGRLGQRVQAVPSPAGWPDAAVEWLGPDAVWKRVEWATRVAERMGRNVDARALAMSAFGPLLGENTTRQIDRAADGPQALALLLLSPEFQRR